MQASLCRSWRRRYQHHNHYHFDYYYHHQLYYESTNVRSPLKQYISDTNKMITIPSTTKMKNLTCHHRPTLTTSICLALGHLHLLLKKRFRGRVQLRVEPLPSYSKYGGIVGDFDAYGDDSVVNEFELARTCLLCICGLEDKIWRRSSMQSGSCFGLLIFSFFDL